MSALTHGRAHRPPQVQVIDVDPVDADHLALVVRCLAHTRLGTRFHCTDRRGNAVDLALVEIRRNPTLTVDELEPPHGARILLAGAGAGAPTGPDGVDVRAGDVLLGTSSAA
ncbi:hypothetical protein [Streptomyces sp. BE303]|uniref:hypothetical protein n=1 Tax=Streptomyces sp. BE303 TaxID=3002528 RepID=UPI002E797B9A|nr:hypothetical protein [Streptomyces sp. BE303]MED7952492.1 hypothetical protein [Streptomyces sp. BE303]